MIGVYAQSMPIAIERIPMERASESVECSLLSVQRKKLMGNQAVAAAASLGRRKPCGRHHRVEQFAKSNRGHLTFSNKGLFQHSTKAIRWFVIAFGGYPSNYLGKKSIYSSKGIQTKFSKSSLPPFRKTTQNTSPPPTSLQLDIALPGYCQGPTA